MDQADTVQTSQLADAQIAITLAAIAYLRGNTQAETFSKMAKALQQKDLPTHQQWGLVWGPVTYESNLMYIVQGPKTQYGRKFAVAIRGTVWTPTSIFEDIELDLESLPWTDPSAPAGTRIAKGIRHGFERLAAMQQPTGGGRVETALEFLKRQPGRNEIIVTGHSQGGCLASLVPLWLKTELASTGAIVKPFTFAGETAGNQDFANYFASTFSNPIRFYNQLDIVPRGWNYDTLKSIKLLYPGNGPKCDWFYDGLIDVAMDAAGHNYFQPNNGAALDGRVYDENGWFPFVDEITAQHSHIYYMYLMGIPLSVIQGTPFHPGLGAGWWPPGVKPQAEPLQGAA
ncbi:MAG: hypothetical protein AAF402_06275 [Pseudomonadota bacterium]